MAVKEKELDQEIEEVKLLSLFEKRMQGLLDKLDENMFLSLRKFIKIVKNNIVKTILFLKKEILAVSARLDRSSKARHLSGFVTQ